MIRIAKELGDSVNRGAEWGSREAYRSELEGSWQVDQDTVRAWAEAVSRYCPGLHVNVDEPDTPERTARRERTAKVQKMYNEIFEERAFGEAFQKLRVNSNVPRPLWTLMSHAPNSEQHNQKVADILQNGTREQITEMVREHVQRAHAFIQKAEGYNDQQLADNGHEIYHNAKIVMDIPNMMDLVKNGTLDASLSPLLEEIHNSTEEIGQQLQARMQAMATPLYPYTTPEELMNLDGDNLYFAIDNEDNTLAPAIRGNEAAGDYVARIQELQMGVMRRRGEWLQEQMVERYGSKDIPWFNPNDGTRLIKNLKDIRPNQPVGVQDPDSGEVEFHYLKEGSNHQITDRKVTLEQYLNRQIVSRVSDLSESLEIADHATTFGSSEFRSMRNAMKTLRENFQPLGDSPTWEQRRTLFNQLTDLRDAANTYLKHKGDGPYKHDAERSRVLIGQQLKEFAQQQLDVLELKNLPQQMQKATQIPEDQMKKLQKAGMELKKAKNAYDNLHNIQKGKKTLNPSDRMTEAIKAVREAKKSIPETPEERNKREAREKSAEIRKKIQKEDAAAKQGGKGTRKQRTEAEGLNRKIRNYKRTSPILKKMGNELPVIHEGRSIDGQSGEKNFSADVTKVWKAKHLQVLKMGKNIDPDSHVGQIYESALDKLSDNRTAELMSARSFTPEQAAHARNLMGELAVVDLVLQERTATKGGPGTVEQFLNGTDPKAFVKAMTGVKEFQDMTKNLTPKKFSELLQKNGERSFTRKLTEKFRKEAIENKRRRQKQQAPREKQKEQPRKKPNGPALK